MVKNDNVQLEYIFIDDVTGMKAHSSLPSSSQNGTACCDVKTTSDIVSQSSLSQKSQLTDNDNIPEEVSLQCKFISRPPLSVVEVKVQKSKINVQNRTLWYRDLILPFSVVCRVAVFYCSLSSIPPGPI